MKIPAWLLSVIGTIMTAAIIGAFAWAFNVNAKVCSHDARIDSQNTNLIEYKSDTKADIRELKDLIIGNNKDNKEDHDRMYKSIERVLRGRP